VGWFIVATHILIFSAPSIVCVENTTNYWHIYRTLAISNGVVYCYGRVSIMTAAAKAALNLLLLVAVLLGGQQRLVSSAPIVRSPAQDVGKFCFAQGGVNGMYMLLCACRHSDGLLFCYGMSVLFCVSPCACFQLVLVFSSSIFCVPYHRVVGS